MGKIYYYDRLKDSEKKRNKENDMKNRIVSEKMNAHFKNVNSFIKVLMMAKISLGDIVVDATIGNGNDIAFMLNLVGKDGYGYGFDIQELAIENTKKKIEELCGIETTNYELFNCGHENIFEKINREVDFVVFNLGYLPKSDHTIITESKTTIIAIEESLKLLKRSGCICIAAYIGHEGGMQEYEEVKSYLSTLDNKTYCVSNIKYINLINNPPEIFVIEKR